MAWQQAIADIQHRFLPPDQQPGTTAVSDVHRPHEEILTRSPFRHVQQLVYEFDRPWTLEQAIGYLYSTSLPLRRLLGERRTAFEQAITDALLAIDPDGPSPNQSSWKCWWPPKDRAVKARPPPSNSSTRLPGLYWQAATNVS